MDKSRILQTSFAGLVLFCIISCSGGGSSKTDQTGVTQGTAITFSSINDAKVLLGSSGSSIPIIIAVGGLTVQ